MRIIGHRHTMKTKIDTSDIEPPAFESVTKRLMSSEKKSQIRCPSCGSIINFDMGVEWQGPDTFTCQVCESHLSMNLVHRALRDLGME
ncbi:MAG: hypothetical protein PVJ05_15685 [Candidatus Thorarchaeota archaeon]